MNAETLVATLQNTYNPNAGLRKEAEKSLKAAISVPGFVPALLEPVEATENDHERGQEEHRVR